MPPALAVEKNVSVEDGKDQYRSIFYKTTGKKKQALTSLEQYAMAPVKTPNDVFLIATQNLVGAINGQTNIPIRSL